MALLKESPIPGFFTINGTTFAEKPYAYLTRPEPGTKPNDYRLRVLVLLQNEFPSSPTISQSSDAAVHYIDIDLGTQGSSTSEYMITEDIAVVKGTEEERIVVRLYENKGHGTVEVGEVTLFFADADQIPMSDFGPCCYLVNEEGSGTNTKVSTLIPLEGYEISSVSTTYHSENDQYEVTLNIATASASSPLSNAEALNMGETDSVVVKVKEGSSEKGKTNTKKQYSDDN